MVENKRAAMHRLVVWTHIGVPQRSLAYGHHVMIMCGHKTRAAEQ